MKGILRQMADHMLITIDQHLSVDANREAYTIDLQVAPVPRLLGKPEGSRSLAIRHVL